MVQLTIVDMIRKFQCAGCVWGSDPLTCDRYRLLGAVGGGWGFYCESHSAGTFMSGVGRVAIGLPKGFDRYGAGPDTVPLAKMRIRLHPAGPPLWDRCNVPVWKLAEDGLVFVRTYAPRVNSCYVDVVQGVEIDAPCLAGAIDVGPFHDEID